MDSESDVPLARVAAFVRQHTHDLRNSLNSLDLETSLLGELVTDDEAGASVDRVRTQLRTLAERMRGLSAFFQDLRLTAAPLAASELWLIWKEKHGSLADAPAVRWEEGVLGAARVNVDAEMMARVFGELLANAAAFSRGATVTASVRAEGGKVIFELAEPKDGANVDPAGWGEALSTTRRGGYGLGLWMVHRIVEAHGGAIVRRFLPEERRLVTAIVLPVA